VPDWTECGKPSAGREAGTRPAMRPVSLSRLTCGAIMLGMTGTAVTSGPCSARVEYVTGKPLVPCGVTGRAMRRACLHEHVADVFACQPHLELLENGFCITCLGTDGHQCPIRLTALP
jgi:hypothetical protein